MSQDPSQLLLEHHLKALKLPTLLRDYASVAAVCSQERCNYPQYLLRLVERELIDRERRATERRIQEAQFPVIKTIESFDFQAMPSLNEPLVRELLRGEYTAKKENLLRVGNPGTGKTHLATAPGFAACSQGKRVRFFSTTGLVTQLLEQREDRKGEPDGRIVADPKPQEAAHPRTCIGIRQRRAITRGSSAINVKCNAMAASSGVNKRRKRRISTPLSVRGYPAGKSSRYRASFS
jgi:hypothetical protein